MKNFAFISFILSLLFSCQSDKKNDITLSVYIANNTTLDTIIITDYDNPDSSYVMARNEQGQFKNSFHFSDGFYLIKFESEYTTVFLQKGYDLLISIHDFESFDESIKAKGQGERVNNFLFEQYLEKNDKIQLESLADLEPSEFEQIKNQLVDGQNKKLQALKIDTETRNILAEKLENEMHQYELYYKQQYDFKVLTDTITVAPNFSGADVSGRLFSLSDFRGSMVYIDVWASWCTPCVKESPFFKQLQTEYAQDNIQFISISMDCPEQIDAWKIALLEHDLKGIQLIADSCFESSIAQDYYINSIPRFILVDKRGLLIDIDAPRPSSSEIRELINKHLGA